MASVRVAVRVRPMNQR
ncbi:uncharacterized, partial [Tachysurus ichikawai]